MTTLWQQRVRHKPDRADMESSAPGTRYGKHQSLHVLAIPESSSPKLMESTNWSTGHSEAEEPRIISVLEANFHEQREKNVTN